MTFGVTKLGAFIVATGGCRNKAPGLPVVPYLTSPYWLLRKRAASGRARPRRLSQAERADPVAADLGGKA